MPRLQMWVRLPPAGLDGRRIPDACRVQDARRPGAPVPCFARCRTDEIACPEPPHPPGRHCRSSERIVYTLVIHGGSRPHVACTIGVERKNSVRSIVHAIVHVGNSSGRAQDIVPRAGTGLVQGVRSNSASRFRSPSCLAGSAATSSSASDCSSRR
jgi:hypothetical protein